MPAAMTIKEQDFQNLVRELKKVDADLYNEFRREFRQEMKPLGDKLASNIPVKSPLSGFLGRNGAEAPYLWRKSNASISVGSRSRGRKRASREVVSINFKQAAFNILELAGVANKGKDKGGMTYRGENLVRGLAKAGYPLGDRGRWVIPQYYKMQPQVRQKAIAILQKYGDKVSRKLGGVS
jgi:hypothetical protein